MKNHKKYLATIAILLPIYSYATLGENEASIAADSQALSAQSSLISTNNAAQSVLQNVSYKVTTIQTKNNISIKEFVNNGQVFAIKWQGAAYPNFKQIFGKYAPQLKTATQKSDGLSSALLTGQDFIYYTSGIPGHISGTAYVPSLVPVGLDINLLK